MPTKTKRSTEVDLHIDELAEIGMQLAGIARRLDNLKTKLPAPIRAKVEEFDAIYGKFPDMAQKLYHLSEIHS